jgi:hypothetical protein
MYAIPMFEEECRSAWSETDRYLPLAGKAPLTGSQIAAFSGTITSFFASSNSTVSAYPGVHDVRFDLRTADVVD